MLVEFLSFLALAGANYVRPSVFDPTVDGGYFSDLDREDLRAYFDGDYDPLLGWRHRPGSEQTSKNCLGITWTESFDSDGARSTPQEFATTLIASYGDSYVKGGELNNDQTWQYQLAAQIGSDVKNYAVGAYDPYQALLRIKQHIERGNVFPITVLGINEQNVTRVVNIYRPFLYRNVKDKLSFKPGLDCAGTQCVAMENLLRPDVQTIEEVQSIVRDARQWDYWARTKPALEYSWALNAVKLGRYAFEVWTTDEREPLWLAQEGVAAMHFVVSEFRESVRNAGSLPVILFIPTKPKDEMLPSYRYFKQQVIEDYEDVIVLDVADSDFDPERFKLKPSGACHPSEYGHSVIANTVFRGLQDVFEETVIESTTPAAEY